MAGIKISALPPAGALTGVEYVPAAQGGVTVRVSLNSLAGFIGANATLNAANLTGTVPGAAIAFANPTASVGLTAVNGSANTPMRSDAAPALSQAITPTWTGLHQWTVSPAVVVSAGNAELFLNDVAGTHNAAIECQAAGVTKWIIGKDASNNLTIWDNAAGNNAISAITNGGQVTIARATVISKNVNPQLQIDNPTAGNFSVIDYSTNGAVKVQTYWDDTGGHYNIATLTAAGNISLLPNNSGCLTALASGGVGLGTVFSDPGLGGLWWNGSLIGRGTAPQITLGANGGNAGQINFNGNTAGFASVGAGPNGGLGLTFASAKTVTVTENTQGTAFAIAGLGAAIANQVTATPAATTAAPSLAATGTDTNILLSLLGKGTSGVSVQRPSTNTAQATGTLGEYITATGTGVALTSGTAVNICSISLTAGEWDVTGMTATTLTGQTTGTSCSFVMCLSTVSASTTAIDNMGQMNVGYNNPTGTGNPVGSVRFLAGPSRLLVSSTTTIWLVIVATYTATSAACTGMIRARRC